MHMELPCQFNIWVNISPWPGNHKSCLSHWSHKNTRNKWKDSSECIEYILLFKEKCYNQDPETWGAIEIVRTQSDFSASNWHDILHNNDNKSAKILRPKPLILPNLPSNHNCFFISLQGPILNTSKYRKNKHHRVLAIRLIENLWTASYSRKDPLILRWFSFPFVFCQLK